jgi:hypothetical protein
MERKAKMKIGYFIKEKQNGSVNTSSTRHAHTKIPEKLKNTSHTEMSKKRTK